MGTLMHVLREDNEDNACLSLKIMVELHKGFKNLTNEWVQPFFDTVREMYGNMEECVQNVFDESSAATVRRALY